MKLTGSENPRDAGKMREETCGLLCSRLLVNDDVAAQAYLRPYCIIYFPPLSCMPPINQIILKHCLGLRELPFVQAGYPVVSVNRDPRLLT